MTAKKPIDIAKTTWLSGCPKSWKLIQFKHLFEITKNSSLQEVPQVLSLTQNGVTERDVSSNEGQLSSDYSQAQAVCRGDFLLNPMDLLSGWVAMSEFEGVTSNAYFVFRPRNSALIPEADSRFLLHVMQMYYKQGILEPFGKGVGRPENGGGRWTLNRNDLNSIPLPVPPLDEQKAIADFLDRELAQIDTLIEKQEEFLSILSARRQSLVSKTVSDKSVAVSLGLTSQHDVSEWQKMPLKHLVQLNPEVLSEDTDSDLVLDYIEISGVNLADGVFDSTEVSFGDAPSRARRVVRNADVLISTVRTYLKAVGQVHENLFRNQIVASTGFAVLRPLCVNPRYLLYAVSCDEFVNEVEARSTGISYPAINASELVRIRIDLPPEDTQIAIARYLDEQLLVIKSLMSGALKLKRILIERRQSLISAAVTGKIDVRKVS